MYVLVAPCKHVLLANLLPTNVIPNIITYTEYNDRLGNQPLFVLCTVYAL